MVDMPAAAFGKFAVSTLVGMTPAFGWAGSRITAECHVPTEQWSRWWQASLDVLGQLASQHAAIAAWRDALAARGRSEDDADPLLRAWAGLGDVLGLPAYPMRSAGTDDGTMVSYTACPYDEITREGMLLVGRLLHWGWAVAAGDRLTIGGQAFRTWRDGFDRMGTLLPLPDVMAWHRRLWQEGIAWQWRGQSRTRVGQGSRQAVVEGAPAELPGDAERWRIPIYSVTGSVGKTTTVRLLSQLLGQGEPGLALAASDGAWIGDRRIASGDCIGGKTAQALLRQPRVNAAIFEQGRGGLLMQGVPYRQSDVGILLNVENVHLGLDGVKTVDELAEIKALTLRPARIAVLNHDDEHCRRIGERRPPESVIWFSRTADAERLRDLSESALAAAGVARTEAGEPHVLVIWQNGEARQTLSLEGVAPYHGMLGEKTVEELLAVVCAACFGPQPARDLADGLRSLRLDSDNHLFRTSIHRRDDAVIVLDKANEDSSLATLEATIDQIASREDTALRIVVLARSASEIPERHIAAVRHLHSYMDEFVCFDRPDTYTSSQALPVYAPGSIPQLLHDEFVRLNADHGTYKRVVMTPDWEAAEAYLRTRLAEIDGRALILVNQPATASAELNEKIVAFAKTGS